MPAHACADSQVPAWYYQVASHHYNLTCGPGKLHTKDKRIAGDFIQ